MNRIVIIVLAGILMVTKAQTGVCYGTTSCGYYDEVCYLLGLFDEPGSCPMTADECRDFGGITWNDGTPGTLVCEPVFPYDQNNAVGVCFCDDVCSAENIRFDHGIVMSQQECTSINVGDNPCAYGSGSCTFTGNSWINNQELCVDFNKNIVANACGDPHFLTFGGKPYDYHGECDLVLIHNPDFAHGLGLDVHGRTTRDNHYSFINEVALRIGKDVLEVHSMGEFKVNGIPGELTNTTSVKFGDFEFSHWHSGKVYFHRYYFHLGNTGEMLEIKAFENIIYFQVSTGGEHIMRGSVGMLGDEETGEMVGRDRVTIVNDPELFASEWQVRDTDIKLFSTDRYPQWPSKCLPASEFTPRLGRQMATEGAKIACNKLTGIDMDNCIFDVVATGNVDLAKFRDIEAEAIDAENEQKESVNANVIVSV